MRNTKRNRLMLARLTEVLLQWAEARAYLAARPGDRFAITSPGQLTRGFVFTRKDVGL